MGFTMSRIDGLPTSSLHGSSSSHGLEQRADSSYGAGMGEFGGQQIEPEDEAMMLTDSAEELSLFNSSKAESKNAADRQKQVMRSLERMDDKTVNECMEAMGSFENAEEEAMFAHLILAGRGDPGRAARQRFGRASEQFVALQYALNKGEEEGADGEVLDAIREALDDLDMEHGPQIRADLNTLGAASEGSSKGERLEFQQTYEDMVMGEGTLAGTLKLALERFGNKDFSKGLEQLIKALGQDLAAATSSCEPTRLRSLMQDLYHLRVVSTVLDSARELLAHLQTKHSAVQGSPAALMQDLVAISAEKWVAGSRFTGVAEKFGAKEPEPQIHFLTGTKVLLRNMPELVFVDADQRQSVFNAVQDALDKAIDREEG